jgi:hypothetical protein
MNANDIKLTPSQWETITGITVLDPDGWDRQNLNADWAIPLTEQEFRDKADESTTIGNRITHKIVRSAMNGAMVVEAIDTPWACSVASEAYWQN